MCPSPCHVPYSFFTSRFLVTCSLLCHVPLPFPLHVLFSWSRPRLLVTSRPSLCHVPSSLPRPLFPLHVLFSWSRPRLLVTSRPSPCHVPSSFFTYRFGVTSLPCHVPSSLPSSRSHVRVMSPPPSLHPVSSRSPPLRARLHANASMPKGIVRG
jgi:hypothetical protein